MASHSIFMFSCLLLVLCFTSVPILAETGCPPEESITPCVCDDQATIRLRCSNVYQTSILERVFKNSERYSFQEVHIQSAVLQYLPSTIFQEVRINELYIENSRLIGLFDEAPVTRTLEKLQMDNTTFLRGRFFNSNILKQITSLKALIINNVRLSTLDSTFSENLPSSLKQIILRGTGLKKIIPGAFSNFWYLDKLEVSFSGLKNITRDVFPRPFNVRFLYLDNNNVSYIPRDLFTDMPNLQFLSMKNNFITEVPEAAFGYRESSIPYLRFDGNPLQCNCLLVWLVKNKPEIIGGKCHSPRYLMGRELQDLLPGDFNC